MYDPRMSDWENTVESARERENEESAIEAKFQPLPPDDSKCQIETEVEVKCD